MVDNGTNIAIAFKSIKFDTALAGEGITFRDRWFLGFLWIKYSASDDFTMKIIIRRGNEDDVTEEFSYTVSSDDNYFIQKLPINLTCKEWWVEVTGSMSESFECKGMGVGYELIRTPSG